MKTPDYLILINGQHRLPENFEDTIELVETVNAEGDTYRIEKKTYEAFLRLKEDVWENDGMQIELVSVYRTVERQQWIFDYDVKKYGLEYAKKFVAMPGHSEHHTGFGIDVSIVVDGKVVHGMPNLQAIDHLFRMVQAKLPKYGFILRYPKGKEDVTKISYEPWHFRYIDSPEIAQIITDNGICFEEFWDFISQKRENAYHITTYDVLAVYEQLKDKYDLILTTTSALDEGFTDDCPIIVGKAHGQIVELYEDGGYFVLDVMDAEQTKGTHWHPCNVEGAVSDITEFMEGKSDYEMYPFKQM